MPHSSVVINTHQLSPVHVIESLHNFARHASRHRVPAFDAQKFRCEYRNFVPNDMATTVSIGQFALHPSGKITVYKSYDLNGNVLHHVQCTHALPLAAFVRQARSANWAEFINRNLSQSWHRSPSCAPRVIKCEFGHAATRLYSLADTEDYAPSPHTSRTPCRLPS
jgi:hypothetical protein